MAIKQLKRDLKFPDEMEFKLNKSRPEIRHKFLKAVTSFNFRIRCIVVDKKIVYSPELHNNHQSFYSTLLNKSYSTQKKLRTPKFVLMGMVIGYLNGICLPIFGKS